MSFPCPDCSKIVPDKTDVCPKCGRKFTSDEVVHFTKKANRGAFLLILVIAVGIWFFFFRENTPQSTETHIVIQEPNISTNISEDTNPVSEDALEILAKKEAEKQENERLKYEEENRKQRIEYARQKNIVVVTPTGSKYHERGCSTVRGSYREMNVKQAIQKGYEPCGVCAPPLQEWKEEDFDFPVYK